MESVGSNADHTCALRTDGSVVCWGSNFLGQLGIGSKDNIGDDPGEMPPAPVALPAPARDIAVGGVFTCALLTNGRLYCWGEGERGALLQGNTENIGDDPGETPVEVKLW